VSDDTFTDAAAGSAAAAAEGGSEPDAASGKKSNPHCSAALLTTEILDILQGYSGSLGQWSWLLLYCATCRNTLLNTEQYKPKKISLNCYFVISITLQHCQFRNIFVYVVFNTVKITVKIKCFVNNNCTSVLCII